MATTTPLAIFQASYFGASGTTTITSAGKLGVGSTTPFGKLSVHAINGETNTSLFRVASSTASQTTTLFDISNTGVTTIGDPAASGDAVFQYGTDENAWSVGYNSSDKTFRIASSTILTSDVIVSIKKNHTGTFFGIGTTTPWKTLSVSGNVAMSGLSTVGATTTAMSNVCIDNTTGELIRSTVFVGCTGSSERFKHDIATLSTSSLDIVRRLQPKSFVYNNDTSSTTVWGFIAEEAHNIDPHLAATANGVVYNIMDRAFTAVAIEAIKALDLRLEAISTTSTSTLGLDVTAGTTSSATTTDAVFFGHAFFTNLFSRISMWLADAGNGITKIFTKELIAEAVTTKELCLTDESGAKTCITKSQLDDLLHGQTAGAAGASGGTAGGASGGNEPSAFEPASDEEAPIITVQGNNPASITIGETYIDLGATVVDNVDENLSIKAQVDGGPEVDISEITIDTSVAGTHVINYNAVDNNNNTGIADRTVYVVDPNAATSSASTSPSQASPDEGASPETPPAPATDTSEEGASGDQPADEGTATSTTP
jgi:hypothetical protein